MSKNMWINFERIMVFIRSDIQNIMNKKIFEIIIKVIKNKISNYDMCKLISTIMPKWDKQLILEKHEENSEFVVNENIHGFVIYALELGIENINIGKFDIVYDIVDILHVLPEMIINGNRHSLKKYWKIYIKPFNEKWKSIKLMM